MRRASWVAVLSLVGVLGWSVSASATTLVTFTGVNGNDGTYYDPNLGASVYAGIYTGTIHGGPTVSFICDDFLSEIWTGDSWDANVTPSYSVGSNVKFLGGQSSGQYYILNPQLIPGGNPSYPLLPSLVTSALTQQEEYNMMGYLVGQMFTDASHGYYANWASEAGAIWSIADGGWTSPSYVTIPSGGTETAQQFVADALGHYNDLSKFSIYTPIASLQDGLHNCTGPNQSQCDGQEFWGPYQPTPEPTLAVLLSVTFLGVGLLGKRVFGESRV